MNIETILKMIKSWPIDERIRLAQDVWERIGDAGYMPPLTDEMKAILDQRMADADAHPEDLSTWEEFKASLAISNCATCPPEMPAVTAEVAAEFKRVFRATHSWSLDQQAELVDAVWDHIR